MIFFHPLYFRLWEEWLKPQQRDGETISRPLIWGDKAAENGSWRALQSHECHPWRSKKVRNTIPKGVREVQCCHRDLWASQRTCRGIDNKGEEANFHVGAASSPTWLARKITSTTHTTVWSSIGYWLLVLFLLYLDYIKHKDLLRQRC